MRGERRNRERGQDADNYNYPGSREPIRHNLLQTFLQSPKVGMRGGPLVPPSLSKLSAARKNSSEFSLRRGGDSRGGNLSKLARIVSSSSMLIVPLPGIQRRVLNSFLQSSTYQNI